ncbi:peroxidase-6 [Coleophoma cylindrospora]|uniref:Peroxidase n=1 Tax=Coleophoma cylindrospora TaxID=1849047 RepID=A0A3D8QSG4_9HELO|nr:peroxidase-6 [Coleophoma cylindrospora]
MRYTSILAVAAGISSTTAFAEFGARSVEHLNDGLVERKSAACPAVWTNVVAELKGMFFDSSIGQCNDDARAAIRAAFHDCGTWDKSQGSTGGCDGSLILADEAGQRAENNGLQDISAKLLKLQKKYVAIDSSVTVADMIQVASSVAVVVCPSGPRVTTFVGRKDNSSAAGNPNGNLPSATASGDSLYALFQAKGFSAVDLAALLGAHSTSRAFGQTSIGIPSGCAQDSSDGIWDVKYYSETTLTNPPAGVCPFPSDVNLAKHAVVGKEFAGFVNNQGKWTGKFADAMLRMSLLGVPGGSSKLIDCTNVIPKSTSNKRDMKMAPIFSKP